MLRSIRRALQGASNGIRTTDNGWQFHVQSQASGWGLASEGMFAASLQGTPLRSLSNGATSAARRNVLGRLDISPVHTRLPGAHARFWTGGPVGSRGWSISSARRTYSSISPENVVFSIMIVNFGVFMAWKQPSLGQVMSKHFITSYSHLRAGYFHTLLTHAVSHKDAMHLFSNMVTFYFFGSSLGGIIGSARVRCSNLPHARCTHLATHMLRTQVKPNVRLFYSCCNSTQPPLSLEG